MENITLGQIAAALAFLVGLIGSISFISVKLKNAVGNIISKEIEPIKKDIQEIKVIHQEDKLESVKRDLVNLMYLADRGEISEEQKKLAHDLFDVYTSAGLNSYVHEKWERLVKEGKIWQ